MISSLWQDLRYALRGLRKSPGFAAAAIATLALGIGGNVGVFSIVDRVVLRALPFPHADRLVRLHDTVLAPGGQVYRSNVLPARWTAVAQSAHAFDRVTAQRAENLTWIGGEAAAPLSGASISAGTLPLLGISPALGRAFTSEEERLGGASGVALVSTRFWRRYLGERREAVGAPLRLADGTRTVVGVLPDGFQFPYRADVWLPLAIDPSDRRDLLTIARLAPGATPESANAEMASLARRLEAADPSARGRALDVMTLKKDLLRDEERIPLALLAGTAFLLVLACANLAALLLSRSVARQREMAIRAALGAARARQVRQLVVESLLLALLGGALGLLLAWASGSSLAALVPRVLGEELRFRASEMTLPLVLFSLGLSAATGVLFGLVPAWRAARAEPAPALAASGGRSSSFSRENRRLLSGFVVGETALATVLLAGAALMFADLVSRERRDLGLSAPGLLSMEVPLAGTAGESADLRRRTVSGILREVAAVPGVRSAAATTINPFWGGTWAIGIAPDGGVGPQGELASAHFRLVTPGLLRTLQTPLFSGRDVAATDAEGSPEVAIVSRHLARRFWDARDPVGQRIVRRRADGRLVRVEVVGVAGDVRDAGDLEDAVYLPFAQFASLAGADSVYVMVRGPASSGSWIRDSVRAVGRVDRRLAVAEAETMDRLYARSLAQSRLGTGILAAFAAFGLLLAGIGIFGVVAFTAAQRRAEIGIRIALGAGPAQIRALVRGHGLRLAALGSGAGLVLALALNRLLSRALHDFPADPRLPAAVALLLLAVALAASEIPARRAGRSRALDSLGGA
jgi:putative ABC transport system permease protein